MLALLSRDQINQMMAKTLHAGYNYCTQIVVYESKAMHQQLFRHTMVCFSAAIFNGMTYSSARVVYLKC